MSKTAEIFYFSGVGNSLRVADVIYEELKRSGWQVNITDIAHKKYFTKDAYEKNALIGLVFPVYGFAAPRVVLKFLQTMPLAVNGMKAFIAATMGGENGEGRSLMEIEEILKQKNYKVNNSTAIVMPDSWLLPPTADAEKEKLGFAERKAVKFAQAVANDIFELKAINPWISYLPICGLFRRFGRNILRRLFRVDRDKCIKCGVCLSICPVKAIVEDEYAYLRWTEKCEQCMRCVNFCPTQAIRQFYWLGFNKKYHEPHFKPLLEVSEIEDKL